LYPLTNIDDRLEPWLSGKYQWIHYGEELDGSDTFNGVGVEGGITYRFRF
jgi:hypothetical protein